MMDTDILVGCGHVHGVIPGRITRWEYGQPNDVAIYRGNSAAFQITPYGEDGKEIILKGNDKIIFSMRASPNSSAKLIYSHILTEESYGESNKLILQLDPSVTAQFHDGTYYYDVAIYFEDGTLFTFIPFAKFKVFAASSDISMITPEITEKEEGNIDG